MSNSSFFPIHERFFSFQGEGVHMGRACFFIRTFGCPLHCPWCDSAGTWHKEYVPKSIEKFSSEQLVSEAMAHQAEFIVITGGEPAVHNLAPLCSFANLMGIKVHIETSGAFPLQGVFDWVTVSPKRAQYPLPDSLSRADELKLIVELPSDAEYWLSWVSKKEMPKLKAIWLHPEWSRRADFKVQKAIVETVKKHKGLVRAGYQIHKLFQADGYDHRSKQLVPLGGDINKGY